MGSCIACDLINGIAELPGGQIYSTDFWVVEHCIGPFGVGSLVVKPRRHCVHYWDLSAEEALEVGPLLKLVSTALKYVLEVDQVYICLWSHMNWEPGHIHFLVQPISKDLKGEHAKNGAYLQIGMIEKCNYPDKEKAEELAIKVKQTIAEIKDKW